jgi:hypothetical protein
MDIEVTVDDEVARLAGQKAEAVGMSIEMAVAAYVQRIAEGTESI